MYAAKISESVVRYARFLGIYARHTPLGRGFPEWMFVFEGRVMFIKFVRTGGELTEIQARAHENLAAHGVSVHVVDAPAKGRETVERFFRG